MPQSAPLHVFYLIRTLAALALMLAAVVALSPTSKPARFGADDRTRLDHRSAVLAKTIGTLTAADNGSFCTAFCVAPDRIATASHCLFGTAATPGPRLRALRFKLGASSFMDRGAAIAGRGSANQSQRIISGTRRLAVTPPIGAAGDWAVAQLERPLCKANALPITTKSRAVIVQAAKRGEIYQVAVHADLPGGDLHRDGPCAVEDQQSNAGFATNSLNFLEPGAIFFHTCDTGGGSSGSPLLIDTNDGPEVVALNVGTYVRAGSVPTARTKPAALQHDGLPIANTAIAVPNLAVAITELSQESAVLTRAGIRRVHLLLRERGLYHGEISSRVSDDLIAAIKQFEELQGVPARGRLTQKLMTDLQKWQPKQ